MTNEQVNKLRELLAEERRLELEWWRARQGNHRAAPKLLRDLAAAYQRTIEWEQAQSWSEDVAIEAQMRAEGL